MCIIDNETLSWDFDQETTHSYTNNFHKYPAMMVPLIAERLLKDYSVPGGLFLDPFCGTGRALLAARLSGMEVVGFDINPLALIISSVKLHSLNPKYLEHKLLEIQELMERDSDIEIDETHDFFNRDYWFSKSVSYEIMKIMIVMEKVFKRNSPSKDFFYVALSETIRDASWTRKSEHKLYRIDRSSMAKFSPNVKLIFTEKSRRNIRGMKRYKDVLTGNENDFHLMYIDARSFSTNPDAMAVLGDGVDLIITSPPYGDSRTTVDYGNFSRLSLQWLQYDSSFARRWHFEEEADIREINKRCLGGKILSRDSEIPSSTLEKCIAKVEVLDQRRASDVKRFFCDLYESLSNCIHVLNERGHLCFLVANRRVKGIEIPMCKILQELADFNNLQLLKSIERNICGKKLPRKINTNSKRVNQINTMYKEHILVFGKD